MTAIDLDAWHRSLAELREPAVTAALIIRCDPAWCTPLLTGLRDEVDEAISLALLARGGLQVDMIILHNLPVTDAGSAAQRVQQNAIHTDWTYRLAATAALMPDDRRLTIHRLLTLGYVAATRNALTDGFDLRRVGDWSNPDRAAAWERLLHTIGSATPLTNYDLSLNGPFGDTDPSVYL